MNNTIKTGGFYQYCETFKNIFANTIDIQGNNNQIYGIAIKKNKNINQTQNNMNIIINNSLSIKNLFNYQPKIGLDNIGAPYYFNAILQCFIHMDEFVSYFKYDNYICLITNKYNQIGKNCLSSSLKILLDNIWSNNKVGIYQPYEFIEKINKMSNIIKNTTSIINNDIKNFIYFLIGTLHEELNQYNNININNNIIQNNNNSFMQAFNDFYNNYKCNYNSIISKLFYAIQMTQTTCLRCNNIQYNFENYFFLSFPLLDVKKYAINKRQIKQQILLSNNNNNNNDNNNFNNELNLKIINLSNNIIDIYDCFDYFQKIEILSNDNKIYCTNCCQYSEANYSIKLYNSPKILILILDIENIYQKYKLDFPLELDLNSYFFDKNIKHNYKLIGVVSYIINDIKNLFLISHCLSPIDNKWYTYQDANVNEVNNFKSQIMNQGFPLLLFYQKFY